MIRSPQTNVPAADNPAGQFPEIEKLVESEDFSKINQSFTSAYDELEKLSKAKGGLGKSRDAKKAMKAIERVMDLLRELLKLKYQLADSKTAAGASGPQSKR